MFIVADLVSLINIGFPCISNVCQVLGEMLEIYKGIDHFYCINSTIYSMEINKKNDSILSPCDPVPRHIQEG